MLPERLKLVTVSLLAAAFLLYSSVLYFSLPVKDKIVAGEINRGKLAWQQYNCNACHQVYGLGGYLGPDLTNVYSTKGPAYIQAFLKKGTPVMPDFHLAEGEIQALTAFFKNIDASGKSSPLTFEIKYDGTIE